MMQYDEVIEILKSLKKVKGIRVQIKAEFWSEEYARSAPKSKHTGIIDRWDKNST